MSKSDYQIKRLVKNRFDEKSNTSIYPTAYMGHSDGSTLWVEERKGYIWARLCGENGQLIQVYVGGKLLPRYNLPCMVWRPPYNPNQYEIVGLKTGAMQTTGSGESETPIVDYNTVGPHAGQHDLLGGDPDWIQSQRIVPLLGWPTDPASWLIYVNPGWYPYQDGAQHFAGGNTESMATHLPTTGYRWVLVYIDATTNALDYYDSVEYSIFDTLLLQTLLDFLPADSVPICAVLLRPNSTAVSNTSTLWMVYDLRMLVSPILGDSIFHDLTFTKLTDVPQTYAGAGGLLASVKADETGLEFVPNVSSGNGFNNPMTALGDMIYEGEASGLNEAYAYKYNSDPLPPVHATATASTTSSATYTPPSYVLSTYQDQDTWGNVGWSSVIANKASPPWIKIDLGSSIEIAGWRLKHMTDAPNVGTNGFAVASEYTIESSPDDSTWTLQVTHTVVDMDESDDFSSPVTARYFRFTKTAEWPVGHPIAVDPDSWEWSINDIRIYSVLGLTSVRLPAEDIGDFLKLKDNGDGAPIPSWQKFGLNAVASVLTIAEGAVTVTADRHAIAAQSGTTDELTTISGTVSGQIIVIQADTGDTITVKHGTDNIFLNGLLDFALTGNKKLALISDGTNLTDLGAGGGGGGDGAFAFDPIDCSAQIAPGVTDFTFTPAAPAAYVLLNGKWEKPSNVTLHVDGLGLTLGFEPQAGDNLIIMRAGSVSAPPAAVVYPAGELGYAEITTSFTTNSASYVDVGLSVTVTVGTRPLKITVYSPSSDNDTASRTQDVIIYDVTSGAQIQRGLNTAVSAGYFPLTIVARVAPDAGSRTYKVQMKIIGGSGTGRLLATATSPAFILIEEI